MKIIHCADIHLGSKLESKFPLEKTQQRRSEVINTFNALVRYAADNDVKVIMFSGDVFDSDVPATKYKDVFYKAVKKYPNIDFLYLKGNHDKDGSYNETYENLKLFNKEQFTTYKYDNIAISGIEIDANNASAFYSQLSLDENDVNIVMLHGDVSSTTGVDKVKIDKLKNKGIDYLALGHIHSHKSGIIDERGEYVFSGCLEGRGFDECGPKGFVLLDVQDKKVNSEFIHFASRTIREVIVDLTGSTSLLDIKDKISDAVEFVPDRDILKIILTGELENTVEFNINDIEAAFANEFFFVHVKDETLTNIKIEDYINDTSLKGEFIRSVFANEDYTDEEKQKIAAVGLRFIDNREVR